MKKWIWLLSLSLTACSSTPSLQVAPQPDLQYATVQAAAEGYQGQTVRWGGMIVDVFNTETGATLTVVQFPLTRYGHPIASAPSAGRFVVETDQFLDPALFQAQALITVLGQVSGSGLQQVDAVQLTVPIVRMETYRLWPDSYAERQRPYNPKHDDPFRGYGYYGTGSYSP